MVNDVPIYDDKQTNDVRKCRGFWTETDKDGNILYCHKAWKNGKKYEIKQSLRDIAEILNQKVKEAKI